MGIEKSTSPSHAIHSWIFCSLSLRQFYAVLYRKVIVMDDKVNTYVNKMFTCKQEIVFSICCFVVLDPALGSKTTVLIVN